MPRIGCGHLLDINNVHVCAINHGFSAHEYLEPFSLEYACEIHLVGHFEDKHSNGALLLIDARGTPVAITMWLLTAARYFAADQCRL